MLTFKQNHLLFTMKYNYLSKLKKSTEITKKLHHKLNKYIFKIKKTSYNMPSKIK